MSDPSAYGVGTKGEHHWEVGFAGTQGFLVSSWRLHPELRWLHNRYDRELLVHGIDDLDALILALTGARERMQAKLEEIGAPELRRDPTPVGIGGPAPILRVQIPGIVLVTLANQREHWSEGHARSKAHRGPTKLLVEAAIHRLMQARPRELRRAPVLVLPLLVRITRQYLGEDLDHDDNLNISAKHVRDGVADALALGLGRKFDDGDGAVTWRYGQRRSQWPGAVVEIFGRGTCNDCGGYVAQGGADGGR